MKETAAYYLNSELKRLIANEAKRLGISESLIVETCLGNSIRQTVKDFERARNRGKKK